MKNCFITVNYNDYKTTYNLIQNIENYDVVDEIVIVDNDSKDDSFEKLLKLRNNKITVLKNSSNKGYGSADHIAALKKYGETPIHRKTFITHFI